MYPNPANATITISMNSNLSGNTNYSLYDIQGRKMIEKEDTSAKVTLNTENLLEGVYLLSIQNGNDKTVRKVIVKR